MAKKQSVTPAIRQLRMLGIAFTEHRFEYREGDGAAAQGARALGVDEYCVVKTLIMEDEHKTPLIVLMHGNRQVSTRQLARCIGVESIAPCNPVTACRHSGYLIGGTSPFGVRRTMPVFIQESILELPQIYINLNHGIQSGRVVKARAVPSKAGVGAVITWQGMRPR